MKINISLPTLLVGLAAASPVVGQQQPLNSPPGDKFDLISQLRKAEVIPTVLDPFQPFLSVNISWKKAVAEVGNTINPKKLKKIPNVMLLDDLTDFGFATMYNDLPQLTLALTDPDARSRDNPDWSEMCHWIATEVPLTPTGQLDTGRTWKDVMPYKAPDPPPKTGKHRYVFAALSPKNGTHETLYLSKPSDRQHWGFGKVRTGLREWAEENGLVVIGANFFYSQHKKQ